MHVLINMNHTMSPTITLFVNSISFNYIILPFLCFSGKLKSIVSAYNFKSGKQNEAEKWRGRWRIRLLSINCLFSSSCRPCTQQIQVLVLEGCTRVVLHHKDHMPYLFASHYLLISFSFPFLLQLCRYMPCIFFFFSFCLKHEIEFWTYIIIDIRPRIIQ